MKDVYINFRMFVPINAATDFLLKLERFKTKFNFGK